MLGRRGLLGTRSRCVEPPVWANLFWVPVRVKDGPSMHGKTAHWIGLPPIKVPVKPGPWELASCAASAILPEDLQIALTFHIAKLAIPSEIPKSPTPDPQEASTLGKMNFFLVGPRTLEVCCLAPPLFLWPGSSLCRLCAHWMAGCFIWFSASTSRKDIHQRLESRTQVG